MQIPKQLPQFAGTASLLIVASRQNAVFYRGSHGTLTKLSAIHVDNPRYSDREGRFGTRGHGLTVRMGAPLEDIDDQARRDFLIKFAEAIKPVLAEEPFANIYLFTPHYLQGQIKERIPEQYHSLIEATFDGNLIKSRPTRLLQEIKNHLVGKIPKPLGEEVGKILDLPHIRVKPT